ncbi:hypothetical protein ACJROX_05095 [Pseudalkalibacillus sp. A8]|uniref:hypothetical protein n=1 Tax=Pseudalkalibacillus sp. A8 TaxID=3382641 RepID=UPI0038B67881
MGMNRVYSEEVKLEVIQYFFYNNPAFNSIPIISKFRDLSNALLHNLPYVD